MCKSIPIVIPAYEPDERLIKLLEELKTNKLQPVIVVDDGSGEKYSDIFAQAERLARDTGGAVLHHTVNRGKGRALKTAFSYVLEHFPAAVGCVTADSDGQHTVSCIERVGSALQEHPEKLILGAREFDREDIPWKSRFGNSVTEKVFAYVAGLHISDTQTGLRGIPAAFMRRLLDVKGERFEFETQMLLESRNHYPILEVPIETIYESKDNHQTHFRPLADSWKIYKLLGKQFLRYIISSLSSSVIDIALFAVFCAVLKNLFPVVYVAVATVLARIISATYNYLINYKLVFTSEKKHAVSGVKYIILAICQMALSAGLVTLGTWALQFIPEVVVKIVIDTLLFFVSYHIQQKYVF